MVILPLFDISFASTQVLPKHPHPARTLISRDLRKFTPLSFRNEATHSNPLAKILLAFSTRRIYPMPLSALLGARPR